MWFLLEVRKASSASRQVLVFTASVENGRFLEPEIEKK